MNSGPSCVHQSDSLPYVYRLTLPSLRPCKWLRRFAVCLAKKPAARRLDLGWKSELMTHNEVNRNLLQDTAQCSPYVAQSTRFWKRRPGAKYLIVIFQVFKWCPETDLNRRHADFQSAALPTELSGHRGQTLPFGEGVLCEGAGAVQRVQRKKLNALAILRACRGQGRLPLERCRE